MVMMEAKDGGWRGEKFKRSRLLDGDFPGGPVVKTLLPTQGPWVRSLVRGLDPTCHI